MQSTTSKFYLGNTVISKLYFGSNLVSIASALAAPSLVGTFYLPDGYKSTAYAFDASGFFDGTVTSYDLVGTWPTGSAIDSSGSITITAFASVTSYATLSVKATNATGNVTTATTTLNVLTEQVVYAIRSSAGWAGMSAGEQAEYAGTYETITAFWSAIPTDIVTADKTYVAEGYNDSTATMLSGNLTGKTLDITRRVIIRGSENDGILGRSRPNGNKGEGFELKFSWNTSLQTNTTIDGIRIHCTNEDAFNISTSTNSDLLKIVNSVFYQATETNEKLISILANTRTNVFLQNNIFFGYLVLKGGNYQGNGGLVDIYSNVFVNGTTAIEGDSNSSGLVTLINNVFLGFTTESDFALLSVSNNATSNSAVGNIGADAVLNIVDSDFTDATNDNYHLSLTSSLVDAGDNLIVSGDLSHPQFDMEGDIWPITGDWNIGVDLIDSAGIDAPIFVGTLAFPMIQQGDTTLYDATPLFDGGSISEWYLLGTAPAGSSINISTGIITITATVNGDFTGISVKGINAAGEAVTNTATMSIDAASTASGFTEETGYTLTGTVGHKEDITLTATSGLGTKDSLTTRYFDEVDTVRPAHGAFVEDPYSALKSADVIGDDTSYPFTASSVAANRFTKDTSTPYGRQPTTYGWYKAAQGQTKAFFEECDAYEPRTAADTTFYARWYVWLNNASWEEEQLAAALTSGTTSVSLSLAANVTMEVGLEVRFIKADLSYFDTTVASYTSGTIFEITDSAPETFAIGADVYILSFDACKFIRVWDDYNGTSNWFTNSWTMYKDSLNSKPDTFLNATKPYVIEGQWRLMEKLMIYNPSTYVCSFYTWTGNPDGTTMVNSSVVNEDVYEVKDAAQVFAGIGVHRIGTDGNQDYLWTLPNQAVRLSQIYMDNTPQRIEICDHATNPYSATIREVCYHSNWTDTSITFEINQGRHEDLLGLYVWHFDDTNTPTLIGVIT